MRTLHLQCDGLSNQSLHEDLHTSTEGWLFLNVVINKSSPMVEACSNTMSDKRAQIFFE